MRFRRVVLAVTAALGLTLMSAAGSAAAPIGAYTTKGAWSFVSAAGLHPPKLLAGGHTATGQLARGDFLLANFPNLAAGGAMTGQGGPLIVDNHLQPVWFRSVGTHVVSGDLQQETLNGKPVLVWWQGVITHTGATASGEVKVVDQRYRDIATVRAQGPAGCSGATCWTISIHDAVISGDTMWVTVYRNVANQNLAPYGGPAKGTVYDAGVEEFSLVDPSKPALVGEWDALNPGGTPNIPLSDSEQPASKAAGTGPGGSWDAYHINAVEVLPTGQMLVTMRNTWAAYLVDVASGKTVWTLGGKHSSFRLPSNATFAWPHDARMLPNSEVTLFDDNCCEILPSGKFAKPNGPSRGLVLQLNETTHTATRLASYTHSPNLFVAFLGSMQLLPNRSAVVGWGSRPYFSEYSKSGRQLLDAVFPGNDQSYRALFTPSWVGTPSYPPSGSVRTSRGRTTVYASWNGATQVARWQVLAGPSATHLRRVATKSRSGFETAITLKPGVYKMVEVRAVDSRGHVLGTSAKLHGKRRRSGPGLPQSY